MLIHPAILAVLPTLALVRAVPAPVPSLLPPYNTSAIISAIANLESLVTTVQAGLAQYGPR
ncbi:hypothetical protein GGI13_006506, partial [Coemansia sp. RSA 455]